jgi:hypothetical protein
MLLNEEEFYENKEVIVSQVVDKLRNLARMEAELLFNEYESYPGKEPTKASMFPLVFSCIGMNVVEFAFYFQFFRFLDFF